MQIINNTSETIIFEDLKYYFHPEEVCFFDIETTGFSAEHTKLYLIGCCTIKNNKLHIIQWFNDDGNSEASLIRSFMDYISNYKFLLHYNGDGFDNHTSKRNVRHSESKTKSRHLQILIYTRN